MTTALLDRVRARLVEQDAEASPAVVAAALRAEGVVLGDAAVLDLVQTLRHDLVGLGPLEPLARDDRVTDVLVCGPRDVWVDRGEGLERTMTTFGDEVDVRRLAQRLAASAGRRLDEASPYVDARLADGSRLHCVIPPVAVNGTVISLRIPHARSFTLDDLVERGTCDRIGAEVLSGIVRSRLGFLVCGGTGSGKTTILSTLLGLVPADERIVIVEDSTELRPAHPHVVSLQSRTANVEGAGVVSLRDLIRQALRMRPDRVVVGEVRGAEVVDLLAAMNTGHEGGCGTVHANAAEDVPARLEALGLMAGLDRMAVHALIGAGIDAVIHIARPPSGTRVLSGIHVLQRDDRGMVCSVPAFTLRHGRFEPEDAADRLLRRIG